MFSTFLRYITLICLCYPVMRVLNEEQKYMTSQRNMASQKNMTSQFDMTSQVDMTSQMEMASQVEKRGFQEYISIDVCFIFLYHIISKKISTENVLATTALFFGRVSAFPIHCRTDRTRESTERNSSVVRESDKEDSKHGWHQNEDKYYKVFKEVMNHKTASEHCKSVDSRLVNIQTPSQNSFVRGLANNTGICGYLWTGVQIMCTNCTDNVGMHWLPGQPSDVSKCVVMNPMGRWRKLDCGYMFAFVCEKTLDAYTDKELLIALLVPILSCLTVAISFTAALLVSSVRRGSQPFKLASRYQRTKRERKPRRWDVADVLRRASLQAQHSSKLKPSPLASNNEINKAKDINGSTVHVNETRTKSKPWYQLSSLNVPEERRRSSNTSSGENSSLYELLARLNKMEFKAQSDTRISNRRQDLTETDAKRRNEQTEREADVEEQRDLDEKRRKPAAFSNMAFRDSVGNVETNGIPRITAVQQGNQRNSLERIEDTQSDAEYQVVCSRDASRDERTHDVETEQSYGTGKNRQTVRVDVHEIAQHKSNSTHVSSPEDTGCSASNGNTAKAKQPSKGKVIWTYCL